jgi:hypothetical protein
MNIPSSDDVTKRFGAWRVAVRNLILTRRNVGDFKAGDGMMRPIPFSIGLLIRTEVNFDDPHWYRSVGQSWPGLCDRILWSQVENEGPILGCSQ